MEEEEEDLLGSRLKGERECRGEMIGEGVRASMAGEECWSFGRKEEGGGQVEAQAIHEHPRVLIVCSSLCRDLLLKIVQSSLKIRKETHIDGKLERRRVLGYQSITRKLARRYGG